MRNVPLYFCTPAKSGTSDGSVDYAPGEWFLLWAFVTLIAGEPMMTVAVESREQVSLGDWVTRDPASKSLWLVRAVVESPGNGLKTLTVEATTDPYLRG